MSLAASPMDLLATLGGVLAFLAAAFAGLGRLLIAQFEGRLEERFAAQDALWTARFATLEQLAQREAQDWQRVEREILTLKAELPLHYVRREDYIRNQSIIEAKLDGLAVKIENAQLRGDLLNATNRKPHD